MKTSALAVSALTAAICLETSSRACADVVTDWNRTAMEALKAANVPPNPLSRSMAMVHVAMSDAVNSVQGRYARYAATFPAAPGASAEAAAASAARHMLLRLYPSQKDRIEEAYAGSLKAIADGPAKNDGLALGEQVAGIIHADRSTDAPDTYRPITTPGVWIPTTLPSFAEYGQAKPWVMTVQAAITTGVAAAVLESVFGKGPVSLTLTNADVRLQREFNSIAQMAEEIRLGRIWAGVYFRNSLQVSDEMGRKLAGFLIENSLQPTR